MRRANIHRILVGFIISRSITVLYGRQRFCWPDLRSIIHGNHKNRGNVTKSKYRLLASDSKHLAKQDNRKKKSVGNA
jgi:hypothetical protein